VQWLSRSSGWCRLCTVWHGQSPGTSLPPVRWFPRNLPLMVKRPVREFHNSPQSSAEAKNETYLHYLSTFRACTGTALLYRFDDNQSSEGGSGSVVTAVALHSYILLSAVLSSVLRQSLDETSHCHIRTNRSTVRRSLWFTIYLLICLNV
jgi:hypothetical protein